MADFSNRVPAFFLGFLLGARYGEHEEEGSGNRVNLRRGYCEHTGVWRDFELVVIFKSKPDVSNKSAKKDRFKKL